MTKPHTGTISFIPESSNWLVPGQWMSHVNIQLMPAFIDGLLDRDLLKYFHLSIDPSGTSGSQHCLRFKMRAAHSIAPHDVSRLLSYLSHMGRTITYKDGDYGYDIDDKGRILKTWELDDGAC